MDHQYHNLSLRLYEILDWVGASEEMRDKFREKAIVLEIIKTMLMSNFNKNQQEFQSTYYFFGSSSEGTTISGLHSDVDLLCCDNITVVERISEAPQDGPSFLMVVDETTKPGYVKLQFVSDGVPSYTPVTGTSKLFENDKNSRQCIRFVHRCTDSFPNISGPAVTRFSIDNCVVDQDVVNAYQCHSIPSFAKSWLRRVISCNRLNDTQINVLKESGCFLVGKNHPSSENGPIEWRLSFSLQERELMASLNSTQHKCYILLKIIKKDIIQSRVPSSISSYHCKTCVLYAVVKTPCEFWTRRNLLECMFRCIKLLLLWVKEQKCPNYFIPDENMFDRLNYSTLQQVQVILEEMVEHWCTFLWELTCDNIGKVLNSVLFGCGPSIMRVKHCNVSGRASVLYVTLNRELRTSMNTSLKLFESRSALHLLSELQSFQTHLLHTECVRDHTEKETRQAIRYFIPHILLQKAQCVASIMLTTSDGDLPKILFDRFKDYIEESKECDLISAYLIDASYCFQSHSYDACEQILQKCETSLKVYVVPMCGCKNDQKAFYNNEYNELDRKVRSQDIPYTEFARTCTTGCLYFLPHLANLVPAALRYEMYRSVNTPPDSRDKLNDDWFDWIVVDSRVYLYFMQYVLYSKINKPVHKQEAIDKLINICTDENLGHRETALNLLGWIVKQDNGIREAMMCFLESWRIRPIHNAVIWHALLLIHSI